MDKESDNMEDIKYKIRGVIVEDEQHNRENLYSKLKDYCPDLEVVALCSSALEGRQKILELKPDLVFLDIEMPGGDDGKFI